MVNMNVAWAGPNPSLATFARELNARFGNPTRFYEYVTGYKSPGNITSHNADAYGRGHGMDIFVGEGHNISVEQGIDLAERLRQEGKRGSIPGHPDRLAYIIHRGRIAGDHTGWEWVAYTGTADHYDHIHISSVFDYYWGDVVAGNPADYNSTAAWNLWSNSTSKPQGSDITPINPSEEDDMFDNKDRANLETTLGKVLTAIGMLDNISGGITATPNRTASAVLDKAVPRAGGKGETSLGLFLSYSDADRAATVASLKEAIASLPAADIVAVIPEGVAEQVADELAKRLSK